MKVGRVMTDISISELILHIAMTPSTIHCSMKCWNSPAITNCQCLEAVCINETLERIHCSFLSSKGRAAKVCAATAVKMLRLSAFLLNT